MEETSLSLLDSLRDPQNASAWQRVVDLYDPLIRGWLRRQQLGEQDLDDVTQEVLTVLARKIHEFEHQQQVGSFRSWLRKVTLYRLRDFRRSGRLRASGNGGTHFAEMLEQLADPASGMSRLWDQEHDRHVFRYLCRQARPNFSDQTWTAFRRTALHAEDAEEVADVMALKVIRPELIQHDGAVRRFHQEVQAAARQDSSGDSGQRRSAGQPTHVEVAQRSSSNGA